MSVPQRLGPFQLTRELSRGAMGAVYEAVHVETGGRYALKVILDSGLGGVDEDLIRRFRRESEALGKLNHPHVVRVHAADLDAAVPYLVQDLLTGGHLGERLKHGPLPVAEAVAIAVKLAHGLQAAHELGILHRDLKPSNVVFNDRGEPCLVDFGVARDLADSDRLTRTGDLIGTPTFMAPEQARGERGDVRTDVYGLGAVTYAMLTGRSPIEPHGSVLKVLDAVTTAPIPSPSALRPEVSAEVARVCLRALDKKSAKRYGSTAEFAQALSAGLAPTLSPTIAPRLIAIAALATLATLGLATLGVIGFSGDDADPVVPPAAQARSPTSIATAAREAARAALERGDAQAAFEAIAQGEGALAGGGWGQLRGLALVLKGDLDAAEALLGVDSKLCRYERRRLNLTPRVQAARSLDAPKELDDLRHDIDQLVEDARSLRESEAIGLEIVRRTQESLAEVFLQTGESFYRANRPELDGLMRRALSLEPNGRGGGALNIGWACLELESGTFNHSTLSERVVPSCEFPGLSDRWRTVGALLRHRLVSPDAPRTPEEVPTLKPNTLGYVERDMAQAAYQSLADTWNAVLVHALNTSDEREAALAYRNALEFCKRRVAVAMPLSVARDSATLNLARLHLFAKKTFEAGLVLGELILDYDDELAYLKLELGLLGGDTSIGAERGIDALLRKQPANPHLLNLRAAIRMGQGNTEGAHADFYLVERLIKPTRFTSALRPPDWRTKKETLLELSDDPSAMRARLITALERY